MIGRFLNSTADSPHPFGVYPGFNKPNGTGECIVALKLWNALAEMERLNAQALAALVGEHHVKLAAFPADLVAAARQQAGDVLANLASAARSRPRCTPRTRRFASAARFGRG